MYVPIKLAKNLRSALIIAFLIEFAVLIISILYMNQAPIINDLISDQSSPQEVNSKITWIAQAYDKNNDQIMYRFLLKGPSTREIWQDVTGWQGDNSWTWITSSADIGRNQVKVQIRDENYSGPDNYDAEKLIGFIITNPSLVVRNLMPSGNSLQYAGSDITWVVDAYDPGGRKVYYNFYILGPSTNYQRISMTGWTTKNIWIWKTEPSDVGDYQVYVEIKSEDSLEPEAIRVASFTLINTYPDSVKSDATNESHQYAPIIPNNTSSIADNSEQSPEIVKIGGDNQTRIPLQLGTGQSKQMVHIGKG